MKSTRSHFILCLLILAFYHDSGGGGLFLRGVKGDIADCIIDSQCEVYNGECCARVIVEDALGNSIDSHYCLDLAIIKNMGNKYYFKGILGKAYCDGFSNNLSLSYLTMLGSTLLVLLSTVL